MPKISELNEITSLYANDYFAVAHDLQGLPSTNRINVTALAGQLASYSPIANSTVAGKILLGGEFSTNSTGHLVSSSASIPTDGTLNQFLLANSTGGTYWSNNPGLDSLIVQNFSVDYTAQLNDNYIFCDPNDVNATITIILPANAPEGKEFNVKNLTGSPDTHYVTVTTDSPTHRFIENPDTGELVQSYNIYNRGDLQTWIHDGSVYRHVGSQTGSPVFVASANTYHQVAIINTNDGADASGDFVVYSDTANYEVGNGPFIDMGIDSSTYYSPSYGLVFGPNDGYVYTGNANLLVGTSTLDTVIKFFTSNTNPENVKLTIDNTTILPNTDIIPSIDNSYNLGNSSFQWNSSYINNSYVGQLINFGENESRIDIPSNTGSSDLIRLWDFGGANPSGFNYSIGVEENHIWFTTDTTDDSGGFKFYSKNNVIFKIGSTGNLFLKPGTDIKYTDGMSYSATGFTGSQGSIGYSGSAGNVGDVGYTGSQGDVGYTGSNGYTGSAGNNGSIGYTGSQGDTVVKIPSIDNVNINASSSNVIELNINDTVSFASFSGEILINDLYDGYMYKFLVGSGTVWLAGSTNTHWTPSASPPTNIVTISSYVKMEYTGGVYVFTNLAAQRNYNFFTIKTRNGT
jgi:Collagen triple helix repeat (20 copies)